MECKWFLSIFLLCAACQSDRPRVTHALAQLGPEEVSALPEDLTVPTGPAPVAVDEGEEVTPLPITPGGPTVIKSFQPSEEMAPPPVSGETSKEASSSAPESQPSAADEAAAAAAIQQSIDLSKLSKESAEQSRSYEEAQKSAQESGKSLLHKGNSYLDTESDFIQNVPGEGAYLNPGNYGL